MKKVNVKSNLFLLDITRGQKTIEKHLQNGGTCSVNVKAVISQDTTRNDDGISIEFCLEPHHVQVLLEK